MAPVIRNVTIIGAGGSIGPSILKALEPHFNISIISRKSSTATFPIKYHKFVVSDDYATADLRNALHGQDAVVCCISPWATDLQFRIIDAAVQEGVKRFIPGEFGGDSTNDKAIAIIPPLQIRNDIVAHLKAQESHGMTWTGIITGFIFDWGLANGFLGFDLSERKAVIFDDGNHRFSTSTLELIGEAVAKALLKPERTENRYVFVSSFTTTQNEILETLKITHGLSWDITNVRSEDQLKNAQEALINGGNAKDAFRTLLLITSYARGYGSDFLGKESNQALELPAEDMTDVIRSVVPGNKY